MKVWTAEHILDHPWEIVARAALRKYPNPMTPSIIGFDVVKRDVTDGVLVSHRLLSSRWFFPKWAQAIIGTAKICYASERSTVDPNGRKMTLKTINLTFCRHISVDETVHYTPHPTEPSKTLLQQEAIVTVHGVPLGHYMEEILASTISSNAGNGRAGLEWVIAKINSEVKGLAEAVHKSTDEIFTQTSKSIDDMTESARKGEIWPKPKSQTKQESFFIVRPSVLKFEVVGNFTCDILEKAMKRYLRIVSATKDRRKHGRSRSRMSFTMPWQTDPFYEGNMDVVKVKLRRECEEYPSLHMDESYTLSLTENVGSIESNSIWGILRGLESFSQMLVLTEDRISFRLNSTEIYDKPRFPHRGLLLDTSRHFMNVFTITQILDGMTYNKLNVFHWHIVDDQSFPYQSNAFPELSNLGAYDQSLVYTAKDVAKVIEHARLRGIRVMVEFDTPGHTRSWGVSHPEILTSCGGEDAGKLGPINPTVNASYEFMQKLLREVVDVFPDNYVHIGGDEVGFECWESNPEIKDFMNKNNVTNYEMLEEIYIQRIVDFVHNLNRSSVVWQEVFENGVRLPNGTVVQVWTGNRQLLLKKITDEGLPALLSSCWYLDHLQSGGDWKSFYNCDAADFDGSDEQKKLVLGGEACMWSEVVDNGNVLQRIFPRLSAAAEKLWSQYEVTDLNDAAARLEEHTCRMKFRGLPAQPPNGPGFCLNN
ncbi:Beta-hexosaminidase subunit beta [Pseudolycoriella hygida]|uniref:beta-N-acetylhexosaminidase n=1 Tax=Pseudolycoriella hygida TaxID=35572 RepID=A0A9Q0NGP8_9DIPT|nr:Beta-hexosaminidase subunit beta [Pseudolycoriella hygida]